MTKNNCRIVLPAAPKIHLSCINDKECSSDFTLALAIERGAAFDLAVGSARGDAPRARLPSLTLSGCGAGLLAW